MARKKEPQTETTTCVWFEAQWRYKNQSEWRVVLFGIGYYQCDTEEQARVVLAQSQVWRRGKDMTRIVKVTTRATREVLPDTPPDPPPVSSPTESA